MVACPRHGRRRARSGGRRWLRRTHRALCHGRVPAKFLDEPTAEGAGGALHRAVARSRRRSKRTGLTPKATPPGIRSRRDARVSERHATRVGRAVPPEDFRQRAGDAVDRQAWRVVILRSEATKDLHAGACRRLYGVARAMRALPLRVAKGVGASAPRLRLLWDDLLLAERAADPSLRSGRQFRIF